jgi:hypothetical protein
MLNALDILKSEGDGNFVWQETARDLRTAKDRAQKLCGSSPGEYLIFDHRTQQVVAKVADEIANH